MYLRRIPCPDRRYWALLQPSKNLFRPCLLSHAAYCSGSENKQVHINDQNYKSLQARLGEQEWLNSKKLSMESKRIESPFLTTRDKFRIEILRRIVPWEKINVSWDTFPYHINEHTKTLLMEFVSSHLRHDKCASSFGTSSGRILLQSVPGTELYQGRLVRALAQDLQVPLLVFDSSILPPCDIDDDDDDDDSSSEEECTSSTNSESGASDYEDAVKAVDAAAERVKMAVQKLVPYNEVLRKGIDDTIWSNYTSLNSDYDLNRIHGEADACNEDWTSSTYVRSGSSYYGETYKWKSADERLEMVKVVVQKHVPYIVEELAKTPSGKSIPEPSMSNDEKCDDKIERDLDAQSQDSYIAMEVLCEVLHSKQPLIIYFPDGLLKSVPKSIQSEFIHKVQEMFDQLSGPVVFICGQNKAQSEGQFPFSMNKGQKTSEDGEINKLFILSIQPPKDEYLLATFKKQLEEDRKIMKIQKVLEENQLSCADLLHVDTHGVILTKPDAAKVVDWAKNHYLSSCVLPRVEGDRLCIPRESLEIAISRLKGVETMSGKP